MLLVLGASVRMREKQLRFSLHLWFQAIMSCVPRALTCGAKLLSFGRTRAA